MTTSNDAVQALIKVANTGSVGFKLRAAAVEGLGFAGGFEARTALVAFLNNANEFDLQIVAARALGHAARE